MMRRTQGSSATTQITAVIAIGIFVILLIIYSGNNKNAAKVAAPGSDNSHNQDATGDKKEPEADGSVPFPEGEVSQHEAYTQGGCLISNAIDDATAGSYKCGWRKPTREEKKKDRNDNKMPAEFTSTLPERKDAEGHELTVLAQWKECKFHEVHPTLHLHMHTLGIDNRNWIGKDHIDAEAAQDDPDHVSQKYKKPSGEEAEGMIPKAFRTEKFDELGMKEQRAAVCLGFNKNNWKK